MSDIRSSTIEEISEWYWRVYGAVQRASIEDWFELEMSIAQLKVFFMLGMDGPAKIGQVAEMLHISPPTASQLVERLVQAGYVERIEDATDRRYVEARLTAQGLEQMKRMQRGRRDHLSRLLSQLNADELGKLLEGMRALIRVSEINQMSDTKVDGDNLL